MTALKTPYRCITCDTSGTGSGPSSGSGLGPDFIASVDEAGQHGVGVLEKLREQRNSSRFCDVVINAGGVDFVAHRAILVACSPYFESLLDGSRAKRQNIAVQINPGGHVAFDTVIRYMYSGAASLTEETVADVLRLSERFAMDHLRDRCIDFMQSQLTCRSCFRMRILAEGLALAGLVRTIDAYIVANITEIVEAEGVLELPVTHLEDLLRRTMPLTEIARLSLICRWADHRAEERQKLVSAVLSLHVQWQKVVESSELYHFLQSGNHRPGAPSYVPSDWCRYQVLQILKDKCLLPDIYFEQLACLQDQYAACAFVSHQPDLPNSSETVLNDNNSLSVEITSYDDGDVEDTCDDEPVAHSSSLNTEHLQLSKRARKTSRKPTVRVKESQKQYDSQGDQAGSLVNANVDLDLRQVRKRGNALNNALSSKELPHVHALDTENAVSADPPLSNSEACNDTANFVGKITTVAAKHGHQRQAEQSSSAKRRRPLVACSGSSEGSNEMVEVINELSELAPLRHPNEPSGTSNKKKRKVCLSRFKCKQCGCTVRSEEKLLAHIRTAHVDERKYVCNICRFETEWNREFYRHMRANHFSGPPYICDSCPLSLDNIPQLLLHRMDHTDDRPFPCNVCGIRFKLKSNLVAHKRCHSGEKPFKCLHCERSFATKGTLDQHVVRHSSQRPYLCDLCGFSTKYQSHLISHRRIHTGDVYKCQHAGCSYSTPKRSQLACHARAVHLHVRSHVCTECGRAFVERSHLVRHERLHLADKPFACDDCPYTSTRRDKLKEHRAKHHGDGSSSGLTKEKNGAKEATASEKQQPKRSQRKGGKKTIAAASGSEQREDAAAAASGSIADGIGTAETAPISVRCADAAAVLLPLGLVVGLQEVPVVVNADRLQALADGDPAAVSLVAGSGVDAAATALHQGQRSAAATTSSAAAAFDVGCGIQSLGIDAFKLIVGNSVDNGTVLLTACNLNGNVSHQQSSFVQDATVIDNQTSNDGVCPSLWIVTQ